MAFRGVGELCVSRQAGQPGHPQYGPHYGPPWAWGAGHQDRNRAFWGLILVGAGVLFLIDQLFSFNGFGSVVLLALGGAGNGSRA